MRGTIGKNLDSYLQIKANFSLARVWESPEGHVILHHGEAR